MTRPALRRPREAGKVTAALGGLVFLLALAGALWWFGRAAPTPAPAPAAATGDTAGTPVIIYLIDTLRADRLGLYGYGKPTSPVIDALAKESVVFEAAHSAAPWTLPSVASLITSRPTCEHGVLRTGLALSPALPTLAEQMQGLGYATAAYYQNAFVGDLGGLNRGYQIAELRQDMETLDADARSFLAQAGGNPYLLYLHSMEPHASYYAPRDLIRKFGHVSVDDREAFRAHWLAYRSLWYADSRAGRPIGTTDTTADIDHARESLAAIEPSVQILYDAAVAFADRELGDTIAVLKETGAWDKALFILLADHGEEMNDHGLWFHDQSVYEELTHVPLLIHFPGGRHAGKRIADKVSLLDVKPTILDFLGQAELCRDCRGASLLPLVDPARGGAYPGQDVPSMRQNVWTWYAPLEKTRGDLNVAVRDGSLKGIWNEEPGTVELYDLAADPREQRNLAAAQPERAASLAGRAKSWLEQCNANRVAPVELAPGALKDAEREKLEAHGYFGG